MKEPQYIKIDSYGNKFYYKDKELTKFHREDGPAIECSSGLRQWYLNGKLHREDGPAVESEHGGKQWWLNDERHREDGPAIEHTNGYKAWFINGVSLTEQEFNRKKQPTVNINGKHFTIEELNALIDTAKGK